MIGEKGNTSGDRAIRSFRRLIVLVQVAAIACLAGVLLITLSTADSAPLIVKDLSHSVAAEGEVAAPLSEQQKCREAQFDPNSDVIQLTEDNFYEQTSTPGTSWLVEFYSPYCPHCVAMKPQWEKTATILKNEQFAWRVGKIDGTCERKLLNDFKITGYPTIFFIEGEESKQYTSAVRKALAFIEWAKEESWLFAQQFGRYEK